MAEQSMSPEQLKALQEKIKNMSPEELREFQKKQCIFCQIISGKIQAKKIYEDEHAVAILDINPANPGHILLLTREHYSIMPQIPEDEISHIFMLAKSLSNSMLRSIDAQGTNIIVANGIAAGQRAQHFMVHIIPRKENDGVNFVLPQKTIEQGEIEQIGNKITASLAGGAEKPQETEIKMPMPAKQPEKKPDDSIKKKSEAKEQAKSGIDLDDISRLLGVK
ncbi:HIT family protein [Candidatus Woesearchaeota archaeon]|nr:HIT family protein [Candidatus Woesearchaeota archaeon]